MAEPLVPEPWATILVWGLVGLITWAVWLVDLRLGHPESQMAGYGETDWLLPVHVRSLFGTLHPMMVGWAPRRGHGIMGSVPVR
jgi:hypothetical protein